MIYSNNNEMYNIIIEWYNNIYNVNNNKDFYQYIASMVHLYDQNEFGIYKICICKF